MRHHRQGGSAMLTAVIVVIIVVGFGGAFLAETVFRTKTAGKLIENDEATMLAESALEKARRALFVYKSTGSMTWDDILVYCANQPQPAAKDMMTQFKGQEYPSNEFVAYRQMMNYAENGGTNPGGISTANDGPLPGDPDWFFMEIKPYGEGGFNVKITNNADDPGGPLTDTDNLLIVTVTSFMPDGSMRQIEALVEYQDPTYSPDSAIITNGSLLLQGNSKVDGAVGKVHANEDLFLSGSPDVSVSGNASGTVYDGGVAPPPGGWNSAVPQVPLPAIDPTFFYQYADFVLTNTGQITNQAGVPIGTPGSGQFAAVNFGNGSWGVQSNGTWAAGTYYVQGDIRIAGQGNAQFRTVTIIAEGSIIASGNSKLVPDLLTDPTDPSIGGTLFIAGRDIDLGGTNQSSFGSSSSSGPGIPALIAAHEQFRLHGTPDVMGVLLAEDAEDLSTIVSTGSALGDLSGQAGGNSHVRYDGGMITLLPNPNNSVTIKHLRKII